MSLQNNIEKIINRENEIEKLLVNPSLLKPTELAELSKELSEIKLITELAKQKDEMVKELLDLTEVLNDKNTDEELKTILAETAEIKRKKQKYAPQSRINGDNKEESKVVQHDNNGDVSTLSALSIAPGPGLSSSANTGSLDL